MSTNPVLFYPSMEFPSLPWLKSTLLAAGSVRRIVPREYADQLMSDTLRPYYQHHGPHGPLIEDEDTSTGAVYACQYDLGSRLEKLDIAGKLTREEAVKAVGRDDSYIIHAGKARVLLEALTRQGLAWQTLTSGPNWMSVHPTLGRAIMTQTAMAIAQTKGLNLVTCEPVDHFKVSAADEQRVFESMLDIRGAANAVHAHGLTQLFISTHFDLTPLKAEDIAQILRDREAISDFMKSVSGLVEHIPEISDAIEREHRLKGVAKLLEQRWASFKQQSKWKYLKALGDAAAPQAQHLGKYAAGHTASVAIGPGVVLGVGLFIYRSATNLMGARSHLQSQPVRYLSRIEKHLAICASNS